MKRAITITLLIAAVFTLQVRAQQPPPFTPAKPQCRVTGTVYRIVGGLPAKNAKLLIVKSLVPGGLASTMQEPVDADAQGNVDFQVAAGSTIWLYGEVQLLNVPGGRKLDIPNL